MKLFFSKYKLEILILITILFLIFYRSPFILFSGRFWAEEGSFWFKNSYQYGPFYGLTQVLWGTGYFNLWPNLATVFATFFPLEYAPLVTTYFSLIVLIYLFSIILFSKSIFLVNLNDKLIISLIILVSPGITLGIWLNTLTSQVYFTLICVFIFFFDENHKSYFKFSNPIAVFFSSLSSMLPILLIPFFFIKYLKNRKFYNLLNFNILLIGGVFQFCIFIFSKYNNLDFEDAHTRFIISLEKITNFTYNVFFKTFFGRDLTHFIYFKIVNNFILYFLILTLSFLFLYKFKKYFQKYKNDKILFYILIFFILNCFFAIYGSKFEEVQGRYAAVPSVLLSLIVYRLIYLSKGIARYFFIFLTFCTLITGIYDFKHNNRYYYWLICTDCPVWKNELKKWEMNPSYKISIWPYWHKVMKLSNKNVN
jgi:hypothetical protein